MMLYNSFFITFYNQYITIDVAIFTHRKYLTCYFQCFHEYNPIRENREKNDFFLMEYTFCATLKCDVINIKQF